MRFRIAIYLTHAPSFSFGDSLTIYLKRRPIFCFGESGSPYVLSTPPHPAPRPPLWRFRFIVYLTHVAFFGDSGTSYVLNTLPLLAIPVHHISKTRRLLWMFRHIICPKHARSSVDSGSSYLRLAVSSGDSARTHEAGVGLKRKQVGWAPQLQTRLYHGF